MNFSIAAIMRRRFAPRHELSCSWWTWWRLRRALRQRGRGASRESGAFLLGRQEGGRRRIVDFVLYDDLDPHCLDTRGSCVSTDVTSARSGRCARNAR